MEHFQPAIRTVAFSKITNVSWKTLLRAGQRAVIVSGRGSWFCAWQPARGRTAAEPSVCHCGASWHRGTPQGRWLLLSCCLLQGGTGWQTPNISIVQSKESMGRAPRAQHQVYILPRAFSGMAWVHLLSFACGGAGRVPSLRLLLSFLSKACALSNLGQAAHCDACCKLASRRWRNAHLEARRRLVPVWFSFGGLSVVD